MASTELQLRGVNLNELTDRQRKFVFEYVKDYNATRAAREAGYKNPNVMGKRLLTMSKFPKVTRVVGAIQRKNLEKASLDKNDIIAFLENVIYADPINLLDDNGRLIVGNLDKIPKEMRMIIDEVRMVEKTDEMGLPKTEFHCTLMKKSQAIELLMKHLGMFAPQKHQIEQYVTVDTLIQRARESPDNLDIIEGKISELEK